jgi:hypothetical protein
MLSFQVRNSRNPQSHDWPILEPQSWPYERDSRRSITPPREAERVNSEET